jgi:hypothetical protein
VKRSRRFQPSAPPASSQRRSHPIVNPGVPTSGPWTIAQAKAVTINEPCIILDAHGAIVGAFATMTHADRVVRWNNAEREGAGRD